MTSIMAAKLTFITVGTFLVSITTCHSENVAILSSHEFIDDDVLPSPVAAVPFAAQQLSSGFISGHVSDQHPGGPGGTSASQYDRALEYKSLFYAPYFSPPFQEEELFHGYISGGNVKVLSRHSRTAVSVSSEGEENVTLPQSAQTFARQEGDFVLGGMFAVNIPDGALLCGRVLSPAGMWVESMMYAVDVINNSTKMLPNHKLGFEIRNDCSDPNRALTEALNFVESSQPSQECPTSKAQTVGVVGTGSSSTSIGVANLLGLFSISQVSYSASSRILSDKQQYPYFLRTVPSDENQARVMADLADLMNWNYVAILYSANSYGIPGRNVLHENLMAMNVCVAQEYFIGSESAAAISVTQIIANLKADPLIDVIFTFLSKSDINSALTEAKQQGLMGRLWIASDSWGDSQAVVSGFESIVSGMVGIVPKATLDSGLKGYLASLDPYNNKRNPWYQLTLGHRHGCTFDLLDDSLPHCRGNETFADMLDTRSEGAWSSFIIDAVHSLGYGLHDMLYQCQGSLCPNASTVLDTATVFDYVRNVTFEGLTNPEFRFDKNGDPLAQYFIFNLQKRDEGYLFSEVGTWDPKDKFTLTGQMVWPGEGSAPVSRCSADCPPGSYIIRKFVTCCWDCVSCEEGTISTQPNSEACYLCEDGERASANQTSCIVKPILYLKWSDSFSITLIICAILGFVVVLACFGVYVSFRHTPTIKATSTELSYILLIAITTTLVCIFLYLSKPTDLMCNLQISVLGCGFALYVATLLTKTNRISRIFNRKLSQGRPSMFLNIKYQVLFVAVIVLVQGCLQILISRLYPPKAVFDYSEPEITNLVCKTNPLSSILAFMYNLLLALLCTFQAFRIRKLPGQFNDSRGICFSMLTFCLLAFIFIATTFTTAGRMKSMISALACFACAASGLVCMFVPKIWIVCFHPELNIRQSTLRVPGLSSTLNTVSATTTTDRTNGVPMQPTRSAHNNDSDRDSGASSASEDEDSEAIDNFLEELGRLERELRDAERLRDDAVTKADQIYEELHTMEKEHKRELDELNQAYERERERMKETLAETGLDEAQLKQIEAAAQKGAKDYVNDKWKTAKKHAGVQFVDFAEHLAHMNVERNQLRSQVDELTKECQYLKEKVLASANVTSQEVDESKGASADDVTIETDDTKQEDEETSSKADSGFV